MDTATLNAYETRAGDYAARYGAADLAPLHRLLLAHLPPAGRLLEIGCGTGREAAFLAEHGFTVIATDASPAMLDQTRQAEGSGFVAQSDPNLCRELCRDLCRNGDEDERQGRRFQDSGEPLAAQTSAFGVERSAFSVRFLQAAFPLPAGHPLLADRFDAILALAVVMHLPDADLFEFAFQLRAMLKPGGTVVLSLSEGRAVSAESRAADGRLFRERSPGELTLLFERLGFRLVVREQESDSLGRDTLRWTTLVLEKQWEAPAFSALVEAVETVAIQRGVERWDPQGEGTGLGIQGSRNFVASFGANFVDKAHDKASDKESGLMERAPKSTVPQAPPHFELETHEFADIRAEAFTRYLPLVGKLAAGVPFSGFDIADLDAAAGGRWVAVPEHLAGQKRFVVQIAGDSMAPELNVGDTVVFEYHRSPRAPDQIVIANLAESGISSDLTTEHAVKRLRQTPDQ